MSAHSIAVAVLFGFSAAAMAQPAPATSSPALLFPPPGASGVHPDTHLVVRFPAAPSLGHAGQIRIYDAADGKLVDLLDLSIPAGPAAAPGGRGARGTPAASRGASAASRGAPARAGATPAARGATYSPVPYDYSPGKRITNANTLPGTPSGVALPTPRDFQLTIIGGFSDGFHFYPVIIHDNVATIYPHNNLLEYGHSYYVQIDPGVLTLADGSFNGVAGNSAWTFSTSKTPPPADADRLVVAADGSGDFNTVQGAMDFLPDHSPRRVTVFIKNGDYEEIVYFRNKDNVTLLGEDREKVNVFYANNEVFNPHPSNVLTNEWPGTFPSRRAAFMMDHCTGMELLNLSVRTTAYGQAEGLLIVGGKNIVSHVNIKGSGDALQINDSVYLDESQIVGDGDTILGRGPGFFRNCELRSRGAFMWIRNTAANHGWIFDHCSFETTGGGETVLARAPTNGGRSYADAEVVLLDCTLKGISPAGWGPLGGDTSKMHFWELNSTTDGRPIDASQRHPASKQLSMEKDAAIIAQYRDPSFVLGGWQPAMKPVMLRDPQGGTHAVGEAVNLKAEVAAIPAPTYQWYKDGQPIAGRTGPELQLAGMTTSDAGRYEVVVSNNAGSLRSKAAVIEVK